MAIVRGPDELTVQPFFPSTNGLMKVTMPPTVPLAPQCSPPQVWSPSEQAWLSKQEQGQGGQRRRQWSPLQSDA